MITPIISVIIGVICWAIFTILSIKLQRVKLCLVGVGLLLLSMNICIALAARYING